MISFDIFFLNVIIWILFYIILSLLSQHDEDSKRQRLGGIHERLDENTRRNESLLFQIHSIVFDKTEQILCFFEAVVAKNVSIRILKSDDYTSEDQSNIRYILDCGTAVTRCDDWSESV